MSKYYNETSQRHGMLALWCLLLLASASSVKALPTAKGIWEDHTPIPRRLLSTAESATVQAKPAQVTTWESAPSCLASPTPGASTPDTEGRLWGWDNNTKTPCAYKDQQNHVIFFVDYAPGSWLHTGACTSAPFADDSVADSHFKVWGWDGGRLCAYKDDQQRPTPINKANNKLAWADAPACTLEPEPTVNNAVPDRLGCLWGWQLDRNCAFKNETTSVPKQVQGYNITCTASLVASNTNDPTGVDIIGEGSGSGPVVSAVGSNDRIEDHEKRRVGSITAVAAGHREQPPYYTPEEVEQMFNSTSYNVNGHGTNNTNIGDLGNNKDFMATVASVDDTHMGPSDVPGQHNAPWTIQSHATSKDGEQSDGKARHLLKHQDTTDDGKAIQKAVPEDCSNGGLNSLEGPSHASATYDTGIGGMTLPRPRGLARGFINVQWLDSANNNIFAAEKAVAQESQTEAEIADNIAGAGLPSTTGTRLHMLTPARKLLSTARAVAVSSGGQAVSQSLAAGRNAGASSQANSSGNGTALSVGIADGTSTMANASASATGNHTAVAVVQARHYNTSSGCIVSGTAVNNVTVLTGCDEPPLVPEGSTNASTPALNGLATSWKSAPSCETNPTNGTAVADTLNRLWGFEKNVSCAFRAANGESLSYVGFKALDWDTAEACPQTCKATNSMSDAAGRLWGWISGKNCAFKDVHDLPVYYPEYFMTPSRTLQASGGKADDLQAKPTGPVMWPSAAEHEGPAMAERSVAAVHATGFNRPNVVTFSNTRNAVLEQTAEALLKGMMSNL